MLVTDKPLLTLTRADKRRPVARIYGPPIAGNADPGITWHCAKCGRVLLSAVWSRQFLDLLFWCPECGSVSASERREPGEAMPVRSLRLEARRWHLRSEVDVRDKPVVMAGESAFAGYVRETGARYDQGAPPRLGQDLDAAVLTRLSRAATLLLGSNYEELVEVDRRGHRSKTPPTRRHRMVELIQYAEEAARILAARKGDEPITLDGDALNELLAIVELFDRWRHHPAWHALRDSLIDGVEVQHSVMTLGIASLLVDAGNGVELVDHSAAEHRVCDLVLIPRIIERLEIEVKTPLVLRNVQAFKRVDVKKLVTGVIERAAATTGGQLDPQHSGIVAIGAFHLGTEGLDSLEAAVTDVLAAQAKVGRKSHLMAVIIFEVSFLVQAVSTSRDASAAASLTSAMNHRLVQYPGYGRSLSIQREAPWLDWTEGKSVP